MPSVAPSPDNDYRFPPSPLLAFLDREAWDEIMGGARGIGTRLRALEAVSTGIAAIQAELQQFGLQRLDEAILPLIEETRANITALQQQVADTVEANGEIIENFQAQIDAAILSLSTSIDQLRDQVDLILAGGIPAANVQESSTRVFVTPDQKEGIGELRTDLDALTSALSALATDVGKSVVKLTWSTKTANFNAAAGNTYIVAAGLNVTFPAAPAEADQIGLVIESTAETSAVTVILSGKSFDGATTNIIIKIGISLLFEYRDGAWRLVP